MMEQVKFSGLGLVASSRRQIRDGSMFDRYFPRPERSDPIINRSATVHDTVNHCADIVKKTLSHTKRISAILKRDDLRSTLKSVFDFFYKHYQYEQDADGVEQLRSPCRAWHDRGSSHSGGIDCDCFSISISSILMNLGIPHYFRIVKMYGREYYQHIYVIVPKMRGLSMENRSNYYVVDPVLDRFDYEAPKITYKKDYPMIPVQYLNGVEPAANPSLMGEFEGLGSALGCSCGAGLQGDMYHRLKRHIRNTHRHIHHNPHMYHKMYQPHVLKSMYGELVHSMDKGDNHFEAKLDELSNREHEALQPHLRGLGDVLHADDHSLYSGLFSIQDENTFSGFAGVYEGRALMGLGRAKKKRAGIFSKLKNAVKHIKSAAGKVLDKAKKIAKKIIKYNPLLLTVRAGFLVAMRTNFARLASKAYWGYFSKAEAMKKGVTGSYWEKSKRLLDMLHQRFRKIQGDDGVLRRAILNGRAAKRVGKKAMNGLGFVVTAAFATVITAAMGVLASILKFASGLFKKGNGKEETETGGEQPAVSDDPKVAATQTDPGQIVKNDDSVKQAIAANTSHPEESDPATSEKKKVESGQNAPSSDSSDSSGSNSHSGSSTDTSNTEDGSNSAQSDKQGDTEDTTKTPEGGKKAEQAGMGGSAGMLIAAAVVGGLLLLGKKKPEHEPAHAVSGPEYVFFVHRKSGHKSQKKKKKASIKLK